MSTFHRRLFTLLFGVACAALVPVAIGWPAHADTGEFSIQVYPSPLVTTVKPGTTTTQELHIHNGGPTPENLKIAPRAFKINKDSQQLQIEDTTPPDIASWISFSAPTFTVQPGQTVTDNVTLAVPKEAGFSYAFALAITRAAQAQQPSGRTLKATVAIFSLINVDRPGAVRQLQLAGFKASQGIYEYLPATFNITFKNTGNTIVQPSGTVYIQRHDNDKQPIDALSINESGGYILPGASRTVTVQWTHGFPVPQSKTQPDGTQKDELNWDWGQLSVLRIGPYTAKLIAIYNDGHRDVPLQDSLSFWVIPWKILLGALAILSLLGFGLWSIVAKIVRASKKIGHKKMRL